MVFRANLYFGGGGGGTGTGARPGGPPNDNRNAARAARPTQSIRRGGTGAIGAGARNR